ncbi:MAG TPA: hypothetical protein VHW23_38860 [Kofleriaceae bacterium]|nr:hypothetical protein [Kofleriaceae bacterium]
MAGVVAATGTAARADNITMSGVACKNYNAAEALDIDFQDWGAQNVNTSLPRWVICPIPRSPFTSVPSPEFYADTANALGTASSCIATLYSYQGTVITTFTWTAVSPSTDEQVTFSIAPTMWDYASWRCLLPANRGGTILGAAALAP